MKLTRTFISVLFFSLSASVAIADSNSHHTKTHAQSPLGSVHFPISCTPAAQEQFNQAVAMLHSFWYSEAEKTFHQVTVTDPNCAMGYWGIAMSLYQQIWATTPTPDEAQRGRAAIEKARNLTIKSAREQAYLDAIATLYPASNSNNSYDSRRRAYQQAMERIYQQYPDNEATVFYALSLLSGVSYNDKNFTKQKQALQLLQQVMKNEPQHPGVIHYIIHSTDYPGLAQLGLDAARTYARIASAVPHALHMPSHIFIRLGLWQEAIQSNLAAYQIALDHDRQHGTSANYWDERIHFLDYLLYAYLQLGETEKAHAIVQQVLATDNVQPQNTTTAYAYAAIPARYAVERSNWQEAANLQIYPTDFPWQQFGWCEALIHYAKAIGAARTGDIAKAHKHLKRLEVLRDLDRTAQQDYYAEQIEIQRLAVAAWIAAAENRTNEALQLMRASADLEDATEKDNVTPGAIIPARELLGEMLLMLKQPAAALEELEVSLKLTPDRRNAILHAIQAAKETGNQVKASHYEQQYRQLEGGSVQ